MNPFFRVAAAIACSALLTPGAYAQQIYKWVDANGHVHYGDRAAAPDDSTALHVAAPPPAPQSAPRERSPATPVATWPDKRERADPSKVGPACKALTDRISAVKPGTNWESLYREFDSACPGVGIDCVEYKSAPQNNRCAWVKRTNGTVLNTSRYP